MPSRADRRRAETVLRVVGLAVLGGLLVGSLLPDRTGGGATVSAGVPTADVLRAWTRAPPGDTMRLHLREIPPAPLRDWLGAVRAAGTAVSWTGDGLPRHALETERLSDPRGRVAWRVGTATPDTVILLDSLGVWDSLVVTTGGVLVTPVPAGRPAAVIRATEASALPGGGGRGRVAVFALAGWESRFVIDGLEAAGWDVDVRATVAPGEHVVQGRPLPLDTGRHRAVVVLDSAGLAQAAGIGRYLRDGGGVVVGGRAAAVVPRPLWPARPVSRARPAALDFPADDPRAGLPWRAVPAAGPDAVPLERRDGRTAAAARRVGTGRVVVVGYEDTWRWSMQGGDGSPGAFRNWWADLVAAAAARSPAYPAGAATPAPWAALVHALGPPAVTEGAGPAPAPAAHAPWWLALAAACLVAEWASRRLRGAA